MEFLKDLSIDKVRNLAEDAFNQAKPKTDVEARVYEVLSHKNWGSSSSLMHEVARDTFDVERFHVVTRLMWEGMENQRPAAWRIVFKALTLLEFLVKNGAERCVDDARNHGHVLRAMGQFNYYEGTIDRGLGVREKSKQIMEILGDDERIREERQKARKLRQKFGNGGAVASSNPGSQGYGNQESWNSAGGYGQGGVDSSSPYESGGGYSGRYAGSRDGDSGPASTAPTFAALPDSKPKKIKKKKKKPENESNAPAQAPAAAAVEVDLFSFDDPSPAPAPVTSHSNNDFGAFQTTAAPAPAADDDFGAFVASKASQPDPFATPAPTPVASTFDAFGNNPTTFSQNNAMAGNVQNMATAFGNMTVGQTQQMQAPATTDDEFGDFAAAVPKSPPVVNSKPADPLAKLVSLDGLSKNPRNNAPNQNANMGMNFGGMGNMGMGNMGGINSQNMNMNMNPNMNMNIANMQSVPNVVAAGGGDAISSLMGPTPVGVPQGMGMQPQFSQQHQQQGAMNPQMMQQSGMQSMNPNMMGMQTNMMGNQMHNPMQQGNVMGGMNPNMMGGQMMGNMQGNMMGGQPVNGMQGNMMGGQMMGGMQGNMQGNMMSGQMGNPQWR